jgi:ATP-dependent 26S proteasome regulatory subunit
MRAARIAGANMGDDERVARSLVGGLRGTAVRLAEANARIDLSLFESDPPVAGLVEQLTRAGAPLGFSVLLAGLPGTGKTQLAAEVAERLGRPLVTRRASDLLSAWVGETEAKIAAAFRDAAADALEVGAEAVDIHGAEAYFNIASSRRGTSAAATCVPGLISRK